MIILVGFIIGLVLGLTGAGGSVFAVPLLILLLGLPAQQAIGLSLGAVCASAAVGVITRLKSHNIQWLPAAVYATLGALTAPLGNWLNQQIPESLLLTAFSVLVFMIALRMWIQASKTPDETRHVRASLTESEESSGAVCRINQNQPFRIGLPCVAGIASGALITGFLSGLFGVGGGFIIIPTLLYLTGISIHQAIGTSLVIITAVSLSGFASFLYNGQTVDTQLLGMISLGGLLGMLSGTAISKKLAGPSLQKIFSVLMILLTLTTLLKSL